MNISIEKSLDGWNTIFNKEKKEHYHSTNGAFAESWWIYIECGLGAWLERSGEAGFAATGESIEARAAGETTGARAAGAAEAAEACGLNRYCGGQIVEVEAAALEAGAAGTAMKTTAAASKLAAPVPSPAEIAAQKGLESIMAHCYPNETASKIGLAKTKIRVLEMGFGTGLNAALSLHFALQNNVFVDYCSVELYPIDLQTAIGLGYFKGLNQFLEEAFVDMHRMEFVEAGAVGMTTAETEVATTVAVKAATTTEASKTVAAATAQNPCAKRFSQTAKENFALTKIKADFCKLNWEEESFDVVFFDAFSPKVQEELWDIEVFRRLFKALSKNGVLLSYSSQGAFRRKLKEVGFMVESLDGPAGKREITRAVKE